MDYYQGVVTDYLRADRAVFVNTECCLQLNAAYNPDNSGPHWYCDAVAVNFRESAVYLCEISYSKSLEGLAKRLTAWNNHWPALCNAIARDCHVQSSWSVRPWLFIPERGRELMSRKIAAIAESNGGRLAMLTPRITSLEDVAPWKYPSWNHVTSCDVDDSQGAEVEIDRV